MKPDTAKREEEMRETYRSIKADAERKGTHIKRKDAEEMIAQRFFVSASTVRYAIIRGKTKG